MSDDQKQEQEEQPQNKTLFPCACCGYYTITEAPGSGCFEICTVCFWEDDKSQFLDPDDEGGANKVSLKQARSNFASLGACDASSVKSVKAPAPGMLRKDWSAAETSA
jgi:hypothetical protein